MTEDEIKSPAVVDTPQGNVVAMPAREEKPSAPRKAASFVKRHPLLVVAGGLAAGVAISALLPRRYTRPVVGGAMKAAKTASAASLLFGKEAAEAATSASTTAIGTAGSVAAGATKVYTKAISQLGGLALAALATVSAAGRAAADKAEDLASDIGEGAASGAHKIKDIGEDVRAKLRA